MTDEHYLRRTERLEDQALQQQNINGQQAAVLDELRGYVLDVKDRLEDAWSTLQEVEKQTTRTNGRVTAVEAQDKVQDEELEEIRTSIAEGFTDLNNDLSDKFTRILSATSSIADDTADLKNRVCQLESTSDKTRKVVDWVVRWRYTLIGGVSVVSALIYALDKGWISIAF